MARPFSIDELAQAARPTLFDAAARPELLVALAYANLMSPPLWELMEKIRERAGGGAEEGSGGHSDTVMAEIHRYVDKKFCHLDPWNMADTVGFLNLDEERRRLSPGPVDEALRIILHALHQLLDEGRLKPGQDIFGLIDSGRFPEYEYSTIEVIEALSRDIHRKHRPLGVTMCADEAVLMASLALAEGCIGPGDAAILGSPAHYTLFVDHAHEHFWFNGKREFHNSRSWRELVRDKGPEEIQRAVDERVFYLDRLITPLGVHRFRQHRSTLPQDSMMEIYGALRDFWGIEIRQIREALEEVRSVTSPLMSAPPLDVRGCGGADDVERRIRSVAAEHPGSIFELSIYVHRSLHVARPEAYIRSALRGWRLGEAAKGVNGLEDAAGIVAAVGGNDTIFHSMDRLALPDEVLHFGRGSHRERALLLYCLCYLSGGFPKEEKENMEIALYEESSLVRLGDAYIDASTLEAGTPTGDPWITLRECGDP